MLVNRQGNKVTGRKWAAEYIYYEMLGSIGRCERLPSMTESEYIEVIRQLNKYMNRIKKLLGQLDESS